MPKQRYQRQEPTHDWQQIRPLLKDPAQITYEIIRPVIWQPDDKHLLRVGNPRLYDHPYQSPQLPLWEPGDVEWFVIIRNTPPVRRHRRKKGRVVLIQLPMFLTGNEASG